MMQLLGITSLRPGPSGNPQAPNAANRDESRVPPYTLPDPLVTKSGRRVTTARQWWRVRPEIAEGARRTVNEWIRTSGAFDAVIDLDAALRDPAHPTRLLPEADTGDHLHPNEVGHRKIAEAIDLALFAR